MSPVQADATQLPSLSLADWVVLAVICERPTHGFAIGQLTAADGELGRIWQVPRPLVYRAIGRLEEAALIAADAVEPGRGPQRTIYRAAGRGVQAAASWLDTPVQHVRDVRSQLLLKLALLDRAGQDSTDLLRRQRSLLAPIAQAMAADRPEQTGFDAILLAWRRATASATLSFLDDVSSAAAGTQRQLSG